MLLIRSIAPAREIRIPKANINAKVPSFIPPKLSLSVAVNNKNKNTMSEQYADDSNSKRSIRFIKKILLTIFLPNRELDTSAQFDNNIIP